MHDVDDCRTPSRCTALLHSGLGRMQGRGPTIEHKEGVELGANFCRLEERRQNMTSYSLTALLTPRKPTDDPRLDGSWRRAGRCGGVDGWRKSN